MEHVQEDLHGWGVYRWALITLLALCALMLTACVAMTWSYLSAIDRDLDILTARHSESAGPWLAIKEEQAAANTRLDALRGELSSNLNAITEELRALNEKASVATDITPPAKSSTQP